MQSAEVLCPHCATSLRIRDRKFLGREVPCPECRQPIRIVAAGPDQLAAEVVIPATTANNATAASPRPSSVWLTKGKFALEALRSPLGVAWSVAACCALVIVVTVWPERPDKMPSTTALVEESQETSAALEQPTGTEPLTEPDAALQGATQSTKTDPPPEPPVEPAKPVEPPPVENVARAEPEPLPVAPPPANQSPPAKPKPEPVRKVDVAAALRQRILAFSQPKPVAARELLLVVEELCGVPIYVDAKEFSDAGQVLEQSVTLDLKDTTVAAILQALADKLGLRYVVEAESIRLRPR